MSPRNLDGQNQPRACSTDGVVTDEPFSVAALTTSGMDDVVTDEPLSVAALTITWLSFIINDARLVVLDVLQLVQHLANWERAFLGKAMVMLPQATRVSET